MAVGLRAPEELLAIDGVEIATTAAQIRYQGRDDLVPVSYTHLTLPTILLV